MLKWSKRFFRVAVAFVVLGAAYLFLPPYAAYCEGEHTKNYYCSAYELTVTLSAFVEAHNGAFTALATIAIAAFTLTLKWSTDRLWLAGERQFEHAREQSIQEIARIREQMMIAQQSADAASRQAKVAESTLTQLERPYLFISNVSRLKVEEIEEADAIQLSVTYSVANYGKLPAIIKYAQGFFMIGTSPPLPDRLPDSHTLVASPIFAPGEPRDNICESFYWFGGSEFDEDGDTIPSIPDGNYLFLWIIITYRGPFTDQHETRACWIYNESTRRFVGPWGGPEHSCQK